MKRRIVTTVYLDDDRFFYVAANSPKALRRLLRRFPKDKRPYWATPVTGRGFGSWESVGYWPTDWLVKHGWPQKNRRGGWK